MASISVTIKDETTAGKTLHSIQVELPSSLVTVAEIIEMRVAAEVNEYNNKRETNYHGLIQPEGSEIGVNGFRLQKFRLIDAKNKPQ